MLAHRASFNGKENTIEGIKHYKKLGIGVEIDVRYNENGIYLAHDKENEGELFEEVCKVCKNSEMIMAVHIKEFESTKKVVDLLEKYSIKNYFLFETEQNNLSNILETKKIGEYVNNTPIKFKGRILWCDEVNGKWYNEKIITDLHNNNNILYTVSSEIFKKCSKDEMIKDWKNMIKLKIDGICTDFPEELIEISKVI